MAIVAPCRPEDSFSSVKEKLIKLKKYILIYWKIYVTVKTVFRWLWWRPDVGRAALAVPVQRKNCTEAPSTRYVDIYIWVTVIFILFIWKRYVASPTFWPIGGRVVVHRRVWEREFEFKLKGFGWEKRGELVLSHLVSNRNCWFWIHLGRHQSETRIWIFEFKLKQREVFFWRQFWFLTLQTVFSNRNEEIELVFHQNLF